MTSLTEQPAYPAMPVGPATIEARYRYSSGLRVHKEVILPYGGTQSDLRPERWAGLREDKRLAQREEDAEFGVVAMGVRAYSSLLGRFMSADPLQVHAVDGDLNPYGYVEGGVMNRTDPTGFDWCLGCVV